MRWKIGQSLPPHPSPLPRGEGEPLGASGKAECARDAVVQVFAELPWRRASTRGLEVNPTSRIRAF